MQDLIETAVQAIEEPGFGWFCLGCVVAVLMLLVATTQ